MAVQSTVVVPTGNSDPEAGLHVGVIAPSRLSVAVAVNVTACAEPSGLETAMLAGTVTTGDVVSVTTHRKRAVDVPKASVAVQFTAVEPNGNNDPDEGVHNTGGGLFGSAKLSA